MRSEENFQISSPFLKVIAHLSNKILFLFLAHCGVSQTRGSQMFFSKDIVEFVKLELLTFQNVRNALIFCTDHRVNCCFYKHYL